MGKFTRRELLKHVTLLPLLALPSQNQDRSQKENPILNWMNLEIELEKKYSINIELEGLNEAQRILFLLNLKTCLLRYPPNFFLNATRKQQAIKATMEYIPNNAFNEDTQKVLTFKYDNCQFLPHDNKGYYLEETTTIGIDSIDRSENSFQRTIHHEIGHFVHSQLKLPSISTHQNPEAYTHLYGKIADPLTLLQMKSGFSGRFTSYSLNNSKEEFAETWKLVMTGEINEEDSTNKEQLLRIQTIKRLAELASSGYMNKNFWQALEQNNIDESFWQTHQPSFEFFTSNPENLEIHYLTDIDPRSNPHRLLSMVSIRPERLVQSEDSKWQEMQPGAEFFVLNQKSISFDITETRGNEQNNQILLTVNGYPSKFLIPRTNQPFQITFTTQEQKISFRLMLTSDGKLLTTKPQTLSLASKLTQAKKIISFQSLSEILKISEFRLKVLLIFLLDLHIAQKLSKLAFIKKLMKLTKNSSEKKLDRIFAKKIKRRSFIKKALLGTISVGLAGTALSQTDATPGFDFFKSSSVIADMHRLIAKAFGQEIINNPNQTGTYYLAEINSGNEPEIDEPETLSEFPLYHDAEKLVWLKGVTLENDLINDDIANESFKIPVNAFDFLPEESPQIRFRTSQSPFFIKQIIHQLRHESKYRPELIDSIDISQSAYYYDGFSDQSLRKENQWLSLGAMHSFRADKTNSPGRNLKIELEPANNFQYCYVRVNYQDNQHKTFIFFTFNTNDENPIPLKGVSNLEKIKLNFGGDLDYTYNLTTYYN